MTDVVLVEVVESTATVTLNRPDKRNALNGDVLRALPATLRELDERDDVDVVILTGADPAFCAGVDLAALAEGTIDFTPMTDQRGPVPSMSKPLIAAVNGPAVTGGFELALACHFLIASERARFADTHARVGVMPGWGLTVLLPQAIGVRRARQMSVTGNYIDAHRAYDWGLVNEVVPHDELLPRCRALAADIASNDVRGVRQMLRTYDVVTATTVEEGWVREAELAAEWGSFSPELDEIERRRQTVIDRGRTQL